MTIIMLLHILGAGRPFSEHVMLLKEVPNDLIQKRYVFHCGLEITFYMFSSQGTIEVFK